MQTTARNVTDIVTLGAMLKDQNARKHDVVVTTTSLAVDVVENMPVLMVPDHELTEEGVTLVPRPMTMGTVSSGQLADKTGIPLAYFRRMAGEAPELLAANANRWLSHMSGQSMVRTFRSDEGMGFVRALLSDRFFTFDNLDAVLATLEGFEQAGIKPTIRSIDLTERNMHVRFVAEEISLDIADIVKAYERQGRSGVDYPLLFAGLSLRNSEVGGGKFRLDPQVVVQVCTNGLTRTSEGLSRQHVGGRLEEGVVNWSQDTREKSLALVTAQTRDTVRSIMSRDYLIGVATEMRMAANVKVDNAPVVCKVVSTHLKYTEDQADALLRRFIQDKDHTALGVAQAVTSLAQEAEDGDTQSEMEASAFEVMKVAAVAAR